MNTYKRTTFALGAAAVLVVLAGFGQSAPPPVRDGVPPPDSLESYTWQHVVLDEPGLTRRGNGSFEAGMNALGELGYELFLVTCNNENGAAAYHYFKRPPSNRPTRPHYEYRRLDYGAIVQLGNSDFKEGLNAIEKEKWELIAVTQLKTGAVGFHYFKRFKPQAD